MSTEPKARLADLPEESGRTSTVLVGALAARLATLPFVSGSAAVGSLVAGIAALGRELSRTAEGARIRTALEKGRAGTNGRILWEELKIREWVASVPPSPVLDDLRNDFALLLADDLDVALSLQPVPMQGGNPPSEDEPFDVLDCLVGLWAFGADLHAAVEALAGTSGDPGEEYTEASARALRAGDPDLLR